MCRLRVELYIIQQMKTIDLNIVYQYLARRSVIVVILGALAGIGLYNVGTSSYQSDVGGSAGTTIFALIGLIAYVACATALVMLVRIRSVGQAFRASYVHLFTLIFYLIRLITSFINASRLWNYSIPVSVGANAIIFYPLFNIVSFCVLCTLTLLLFRLHGRLSEGVGPDGIAQAQAVLVNQLPIHAEAVAVVVVEEEERTVSGQITYA